MDAFNSLDKMMKVIEGLSLDNLIGNPQFKIDEMTDREFAALPTLLDIENPHVHIKGEISDWRVMVLTDEVNRKVLHMFIVGHIDTGSRVVARATSNIQGVSGDLAATSNSLYRLLNKAEGEMSADEAMHLCCAMNRWGWGRTLMLPPISY